LRLKRGEEKREEGESRIKPPLKTEKMTNGEKRRG